MNGRDPVGLFEAARPMLLGLAYRILGSRAEAEDAVQDSWLKWQAADIGSIHEPAAWLARVCTRRCLDILKSAHRARVSYVGSWLPEPVQTVSAHAVEEEQALAASLSTAFLLLLERLTPRERAAYLLREIFDREYADIAAVLGIKEPACRQLVARARANIGRSRVRHAASAAQQRALLDAFLQALDSGTTDRLGALLSRDVVLEADSGGKVVAIREPLRGRDRVLAFISGVLRQGWSQGRTELVEINGGLGLVVHLHGAVFACVSFAYDRCGAATNVYIVRNPDKLSALLDKPPLQPAAVR